MPKVAYTLVIVIKHVIYRHNNKPLSTGIIMEQGLITGQYRRMEGLCRNYVYTASWRPGEHETKWRIEVRFAGVVKGEFEGTTGNFGIDFRDALLGYVRLCIENLEGMEE